MSEDYIGEKKKSPFGIIAIIAVVLVIAIGGYALVGKKAETPVEPTATTEQTTDTIAAETTPTADTTAQPTTPENNVVVDTKTLNVPTTTTVADVSANVPSDPAVDIMMAPRTLGDPKAPVKITEYSSLTCGHCAAFHKDTLPQLKEKFIDTGKVEMTFKEFPLNQPAVDASMILRCMPQDKYQSFMALLFSEQEKWAFVPNYQEVLKQNATLAGMSPEDFDKCLANDILKNRIVGDMQAASLRFKVQSTPSFIINGGERTLVGSQPFAEFEKAINDAINASAAKPAVTGEPAPADAPTSPEVPAAPAAAVTPATPTTTPEAAKQP